MTTIEKRTLRYDFTAVEAHELSLQLGNKNKEVKALTQEKKSVTSQWTAKINEAEAARDKLSNQVVDDYEHREVECEVILNQPLNGKKTVIRKDSNTLVGVEPMTEHDWNKINEEATLFPLDESLQEEAETQEGA